jgi:hypothetical protein
MSYITAGARSSRSVRRHLTTGVTFASASILALGLVTVPPEVDAARTEVRAVRLVAFPLPQGPSLAGLEKFIRDQAQSFVSVNKVAGGGAVDIPDAVLKIPTAGATAPVTVDSSTDPETNPPKADATALAATTTALAIPSIPSIFAPVAAVLGILLLFGPLIVLVILACPPCAVINFFSGIVSFFGIYLPTVPLAAATTAATAEVDATIAPTLKSDLPSEGTETDKIDVPEPVKSSDKRTRADGPPSTKKVPDATETVAAEGEATEPVTAGDPEPAGNASEPTKPVVRKETPRPVVRDSLGADKETSDPSHRGNGGRSITEERADHKAARAGSSSADSSSADSASSAGGSSDGDSGGSE